MESLDRALRALLIGTDVSHDDCDDMEDFRHDAADDLLTAVENKTERIVRDVLPTKSEYPAVVIKRLTVVESWTAGKPPDRAKFATITYHVEAVDLSKDRDGRLRSARAAQRMESLIATIVDGSEDYWRAIDDDGGVTACHPEGWYVLAADVTGRVVRSEVADEGSFWYRGVELTVVAQQE